MQKSWFPPARFGMFVHFGLYALHGGNENDVAHMPKAEYEKLIHRFDPVQFNAEEWVQVAEQGGARYIILTSKHGEGFCLWDTDQSAYKISNTPFKRDLVSELARACHKRGMKFGLYYSLSDLHYAEPGEGTPEARTYRGYVKAQLQELLGRYGRIDAIWFDGADQRLPPAFIKNIIALIHKLQPGCVVNDRGLPFNNYLNYINYGGFVTPERYFPDYLADKHAMVECCDSMGQRSWGYDRQDFFWSGPELIRRLSKTASLGSNYLLNVGPMPNGKISPACVERLRAIGQWLKINANAIFNTASSLLVPRDNSLADLPPIGVATRSKRMLYLHLHSWPCGDTLILKHVKGRVLSVRLLGYKHALAPETTAAGLLLRGLPCRPANAEPAIVKIEFAGHWNENKVQIRNDRHPIVRVVPGVGAFLRPEQAEFRARNGVPAQQVARLFGMNPHIVRMFRTDQEIIWRIRNDKEGLYGVFVESGISKGTAFSINIARQTLNVKNTVTDGAIIARRAGSARVPVGLHAVIFKVTDFADTSFYPGIFGVVLRPVSPK